MRYSDQLTSYNGLGRESVFCFYKDHNGLVWLATNKGVRAYNGHVVTQVDCATETGLVLTLDETDEGLLLAACANGLYEIDREKMTMERICPDITDANSICGPLVGGACGLWLRKDLAGSFLSKKGSRKYTRMTLEGSYVAQGNYVTDIIPDGRGNAWVSTLKQLVHVLLPSGKTVKYDLSDSLLTNNIRSICQIGNKIYIGTRNDGLLSFEPSTQKTERIEGVRSHVITDLHSDGKHHLYVATDGNGAYTFDTRTNTITQEYHGKSDAVYTFGHDTLLNINYFGYYLDGFCHELSVRPMVSTYNFGDLNSAELPTRSLCRQGKQMVIGTRKGLYFIDEAKGTTRYISPDELDASIVTNIAFFGNEFVIATYESGLRRLTTDGELLPLVKNGSFSTLLVSPKGDQLFAVGNTGVSIFNHEYTLVHYFNSKNSELAEEYLTDILPDPTGKMWISSLSRLYLYDPILQTVKASGFPSEFFNRMPSLRFSVAADGDVLAWSGNRLFKSKVDCSSYEEIPLRDRFHMEDISFIRWHNKHYWIGTTQGLFVVDENFTTGILHLSMSDGLPSPRFQNQECHICPNGSIRMVTEHGIVTISPEQQLHLRDSIPTHVVLNNVEWDGSKLTAFQPLLLNYSSDLGKMYEYTLDSEPVRMCTDGEMAPLGWQNWGKHRLTVWLAGHPETQTQLVYYYLPSPLFWAICAIVLLVLLLLWLVRHEAIRRYKLQLERRQQREEAERLAKMYERQRLSEEECADIQKKVEQFFATSKGYENTSLRLGDLAKGIEVHPAKLSQVFNIYLHQSFADYINRLRIDEFKQRAADPQFNPYSTVALAEMCGLRKSAFFAAFKKFEGCTPNEWMEREGIERK